MWDSVQEAWLPTAMVQGKPNFVMLDRRLAGNLAEGITEAFPGTWDEMKAAFAGYQVVIYEGDQHYAWHGTFDGIPACSSQPLGHQTSGLPQTVSPLRSIVEHSDTAFVNVAVFKCDGSAITMSVYDQTGAVRWEDVPL